MSLSLTLCFSFLPSHSLSPFPSSSTPHLRSMAIEICKHNSLGIERFMKESPFGLGLLCRVTSVLKTSKREICSPNHDKKCNHHFETVTPWRENYGKEKLSELEMWMEQDFKKGNYAAKKWVMGDLLCFGFSTWTECRPQTNFTQFGQITSPLINFLPYLISLDSQKSPWYLSLQFH